MKKWIILIIIALFVFIFIKSGTLEIKDVVTGNTQKNVRVSETHQQEYLLHWDRFIRYIREIPQKLGRK